MKKHRRTNSSLELFLDTICNVFGGILFIAMLIAILIQQTEGIIKPKESTSPEKIAEMQQKLDQISADIAASEVLYDTLQRTMPKSKDPAEQEIANMFYKLSAAKGASAMKKAERLQQLLENEKERIDWENKIKNIEAVLQQAKGQRQRLKQELERQQQDLQDVRTSSEKLQNRIDELNGLIAQKEKNLSDNTNRERTEEVYLPKLRDAGNKSPKYYVLRFNRFYVVSNRSDFDFVRNELGIPKKNRGIPVDGTEDTTQQIRSLLPGNVGDEFISVFVYGDSSDQWHIIRDLIIAAQFEYELTLSPDDTPWVFGGGGGPASVQ